MACCPWRVCHLLQPRLDRALVLRVARERLGERRVTVVLGRAQVAVVPAPRVLGDLDQQPVEVFQPRLRGRLPADGPKAPKPVWKGTSSGVAAVGRSTDCGRRIGDGEVKYYFLLLGRRKFVVPLLFTF